MVFSVFPDAPAAEAESLALFVFDLAIAIRLRWARPLPLIGTQVLNPGVAVARRRPAAKAGDPAWPHAAAGAIALAAASALDLAADLSRRSEALLAVAPNWAPNRRRKWSTWYSPRIASRPPKRPARRQ